MMRKGINIAVAADDCSLRGRVVSQVREHFPDAYVLQCTGGISLMSRYHDQKLEGRTPFDLIALDPHNTGSSAEDTVATMRERGYGDTVVVLSLPDDVLPEGCERLDRDLIASGDFSELDPYLESLQQGRSPG